MGRLASHSDFEGGELYTNYRRYPFFAWRAEWLVQRFGTTGKWLIVGCGWGFLVDELLKLGVDAWGIDASDYAVNKGKSLAGKSGLLTTEGLDNGMSAATSSRLLVADSAKRQELNSARNAAGLTGNDKFTLAITEDVLPVLTDAEISAGLNELRRHATTLAHIVSAIPEGDDLSVRMAGLNWKTMAQWKATVGNDTVANAEGFTKRDDGSLSIEVL